jgi:hypothetical protein
MLIARILPDKITWARFAIIRCWHRHLPLLLFHASSTRFRARSSCLPICHLAIDGAWFDLAVLDFRGLTFAWLSTIGGFDLDTLLASLLAWAAF